jgi:hypothetical protein
LRTTLAKVSIEVIGSAHRHELGSRPFGAEEAVGWSGGRQMTEPGQRPPRSQLETRAPLRPDAIDRTVWPTDRAPPPLSTEMPLAEHARNAIQGERCLRY